MSPSASCSLIGRARVEPVSDWSKEPGGGGEALVAAGAAASRTGRRQGEGSCAARVEGEWESGRLGGEWESGEGVEGGCRRAHTVSLFLPLFGPFFGAFWTPF